MSKKKGNAKRRAQPKLDFGVLCPRCTESNLFVAATRLSEQHWCVVTTKDGAKLGLEMTSDGAFKEEDWTVSCDECDFSLNFSSKKDLYRSLRKIVNKADTLVVLDEDEETEEVPISKKERTFLATLLKKSDYVE